MPKVKPNRDGTSFNLEIWSLEKTKKELPRSLKINLSGIIWSGGVCMQQLGLELFINYHKLVYFSAMVIPNIFRAGVAASNSVCMSVCLSVPVFALLARPITFISSTFSSARSRDHPGVEAAAAAVQCKWKKKGGGRMECVFSLSLFPDGPVFRSQRKRRGEKRILWNFNLTDERGGKEVISTD